MVVDEPRIKSVQKDYGEVFEATLTVDTSPQRRTALIDSLQSTTGRAPLASLGATLAFILICLAAVSGYIRADEATKGYYTNRLRMLTAAGVGASGVHPLPHGGLTDQITSCGIGRSLDRTHREVASRHTS